jgi:predicted  nucleic acid-binding Zn-ribbon protein
MARSFRHHIRYRPATAILPCPLRAGVVEFSNIGERLEEPMVDIGEVLDPIRKQAIDLKDALAHARYVYDALDLLLENVSDAKLRGASQEVFAVASERMNALDDMLDELYRQLSAIDRVLEAEEASLKRRDSDRG